MNREAEHAVTCAQETGPEVGIALEPITLRPNLPLRLLLGSAVAGVLLWLGWALGGDLSFLLPGMLGAVGLALVLSRGTGLIAVLIALGFALTGAVFVDYVTPSDWHAGYTIGNRSIALETATGPETSVSHGVGSLEINLTRTRVGSAGRVTATTGVGSLTVTVPEGVNVDVRARAGLGSVSLFGQQRTIMGASLVTGEKVPNPSGTLQLDLSVAVGTIVVRR